MFEYLFAGNGVFVRGQRPGLEVLIPVQRYDTPIRGLPNLSPIVNIDPFPIPKEILLSIWRQSYLARCEGGWLEILFHLHCWGDRWQLRVPPQTQEQWQCQATELYHDAIAEFHSHGTGAARFSATDNAEEDGFRLYGIIGCLDTLQPEILLRIGLFGHFLVIPASLAFDLPDFIVDAAVRDRLAYTFYTINKQP